MSQQVLFDEFLANPPTPDVLDFTITKILREVELSPNDIDINTSIIQYIYDHVPLWFDPTATITVVPWTENHLAGILSSRVLVLSFLNKTKELEFAISDLLLYLRSRVEFGFSEILSATYTPYSVAGWLNMFDFIPNDEVHTLSGTCLQTACRQIAQVCNPFTGDFMSATTRAYAKNYTIPYYQAGSMTVVARFVCRLPMQNKFPIRALSTTSFQVADTTYALVRQRRERAYSAVIDNPPHPINWTKFGNMPTWLQWSYGQYIAPTSLLSTLRFVYSNNLLSHAEIGLPLLNNLPMQTLIFIIVGLFYPVLGLFVRQFLSFSIIVGVQVRLLSLVNRQRALIVTSLASGTHPKRQGAQQNFWTLGVQEGIMTSSFGDDATSRLANTAQPFVTQTDTSLEITYIPSLTLKGWTGSSSIQLHIEGIPYTKQDNVYTLTPVGFVVRATLTQYTLKITWELR
jgi:hypothetical protein